MVNNIAGEHSMTRDAPPPVRRPGKARVLTEAELDVELDIEAGVRDRDGHAHANAGGRDVDGNADPLVRPRPPGKARVLTEADLDLELELEEGHGHGHGHGRGGGGLDDHVADQFGHGHSHSMRGFRGHGQCHGFDEDISSGGWFNAGHARNLFGGTGFGRRIVPAYRAARLRRRLYGALCVSGAYACAEFVAASLSGSTALLADGLHMLSDFVSYGLSIGILELTLRRQRKHRALETTEDDSSSEDEKDPEDRWLTFGFGRLEVLGAVGIIAVVWFATFALVVEAARRLAEPKGVDGRAVVFTALGGLVVDVALLRLLDREGGADENAHGHSHGAGELSSRAMFLHVLGDLFGTVVVCVGGAVIWATGGRDSGFAAVDSVCTLIFAALVMGTTYPFARRMLRTLMEATPPGTDPAKVAEALELEVPGVAGVHCLHVWEISPGKTALMAHVHVRSDTGSAAETMEKALRRATGLLQRRFGINHTTLQVTSIPEQGGFSACGKKLRPACDVCDGEERKKSAARRTIVGAGCEC